MPKRPKKPCSYPGCPKLTERRYCEEHEKTMNDRYNRYERPYDTSVRYPLCEECKKNGRLTPATEVHHILPINHGGTHEEANLMALCKPCHSRITAESGDRWNTK